MFSNNNENDVYSDDEEGMNQISENEKEVSAIDDVDDDDDDEDEDEDVDEIDVNGMDEEDEDDDEDDENKIIADDDDGEEGNGANPMQQGDEYGNMIEYDEDDDENEDDSDNGSDSEDFSDDEYEYQNKISDEFKHNIVTSLHTEHVHDDYESIMLLCKVRRNRMNLIEDENHKTIPVLSKYEKARILGLRICQLNEGSKPYIEVKNHKVIDNHVIAEKELHEKKLPFVIMRPLPNGQKEYWRLEDLEINGQFYC